MNEEVEKLRNNTIFLELLMHDGLNTCKLYNKLDSLDEAISNGLKLTEITVEKDESHIDFNIQEEFHVDSIYI